MILHGYIFYQSAALQNQFHRPDIILIISNSIKLLINLFILSSPLQHFNNTYAFGNVLFLTNYPNLTLFFQQLFSLLHVPFDLPILYQQLTLHTYDRDAKHLYLHPVSRWVLVSSSLEEPLLYLLCFLFILFLFFSEFLIHEYFLNEYKLWWWNIGLRWRRKGEIWRPTDGL